jgi:hypothetical protein
MHNAQTRSKTTVFGVVSPFFSPKTACFYVFSSTQLKKREKFY